MIKNWRRNYYIIWAGQGVSILTSSILQMSMVWYLVNKTDSALVLTLATLIGYIPQVILGPFSGIVVDRVNRKMVMIFADIFIMLVSLLLIFCNGANGIPVWIIYIVMSLRSIGTAFQSPALSAITPMIVPKDDLVKFAGFTQSIESGSALLSPGLAAILFHYFDLSHLVFFDIAGTFIGVSTVAFIFIPGVNEKIEHVKTHIITEAKEGFYAIKRVRGLGSLIIIAALYAFIYFPIGTLYPFISMSYFKGGTKGSSIVETLFAVGMMVGAIILGIIGNRLKRDRAISYSMGLYGVGLVITGILPGNNHGLRIFFILAFVMGVSIPFYRGVKTAIIQVKAEKEYMGRVLSLSTSLTSLAMPVGLLLAGGIAQGVGINRWFFFSGIGSILLMVVSMSMPSFRENGK
ncbi:MAG: MFS transporter [Lachnospiraceae bacterium]|nr:MFS transporter [Lachnospiraceae bacterium]